MIGRQEAAVEGVKDPIADLRTSHRQVADVDRALDKQRVPGGLLTTLGLFLESEELGLLSAAVDDRYRTRLRPAAAHDPAHHDLRGR